MNLKKITKNMLIIFMILQPLFDLQILYSDKIINIFKFSPATIIRIIFIGFLGITSFFLLKDKNKTKALTIFIIVYLLYTILHLYNGYIFNIPISVYGNYSLLSELFYIIRMFCPVLLIFIVYEKKLNFEDIKKIIICVYFIFSFVMVFSNLFKIALTSYAVPGRSTIIGNIFMWFKPGIYEKYTYEYFASKGLFSYANPLSALLIGMFPIFIYIVLTEKYKLINFITLFLTMLSMAMLGTRIAGSGMIPVLLILIVLYIFFKILNKDKKIITKNLITVIIFIIFFSLIYKYFPVSNRVFGDDFNEEVEGRIEGSGNKELTNLKNEIKKLEESNVSKEIINDKKIKFLEEYNAIYDLGYYFYHDIYPYKEDPDFWFSMLDVPYSKRNDSRKIKGYITQHVLELNNNKLDYLVGFSFDRPMNADIYMENDIITQFYSLGIFGLLLFVFPYLAIVVYAFIKMLQDKKKFNYLNVTLICSIGLIYLISILSGNVFDQWIVTLFLGFITGVLLTNVVKKSK